MSADFSRIRPGIFPSADDEGLDRVFIQIMPVFGNLHQSIILLVAGSPGQAAGPGNLIHLRPAADCLLSGS